MNPFRYRAEGATRVIGARTFLSAMRATANLKADKNVRAPIRVACEGGRRRTMRLRADRCRIAWPVAALIAFLSFYSFFANAQTPPPWMGGGTPPGYNLLNAWSFKDSTNWTSDQATLPASFAHLNLSPLGRGTSLVVDTNTQAWLKYNVVESGGGTNLMVNRGSLLFWFAPGSWSGANAGGEGPGEYARLIEVGTFTTNSTLGWWSIYLDPQGTNLYFSTQTNDLSSSVTTYLSAPVCWKTNYFHFIALTYSHTNTALYLDGALAASGPGMSVYPGPDALAGGFCIGSDQNGDYQARGMFNNLATYDAPIDGNTILTIFHHTYPFYMMSPLNRAMFPFVSAESMPSFTPTTYSAITGAGDLTYLGAAQVATGADQYDVWLTNFVAQPSTNGQVDVSFAIAGGLDGYSYDVFAAGWLQVPETNTIWSWLGQGSRGSTYGVTIPNGSAYLLLGTPRDSNYDGVTDAYSLLIGKIDPNQAHNDDWGVPYAWYVQNGLDVSSALLDPDQDGLPNYQEYRYGTRPNVSEGVGVWTPSQGGAR